MSRIRCSLIFALSTSCATSVLGQTPLALALPGSPPGAIETMRRENTNADYALPVNRFGTAQPATKTINGQVLRQALRLDDAGEQSISDIMTQYRAELNGASFKTLFACGNEACGGFDFRFQADIMPAPEMLIDVAHFGQISAHRSTDDVYVSILISKVLEQIYIQIVMVGPNPDDREAQGIVPNLATAKNMAPPAADKASSALLKRLRRDGHLLIDGIDFNSGGSKLLPVSMDALDNIAALIRETEDKTRLIIVGHSDNTGDFKQNLALSKRRANAVRDALIERGISPRRLLANGVGYLAPITSNETAEGRNMNRRVELVIE